MGVFNDMAQRNEDYRRRLRGLPSSGEMARLAKAQEKKARLEMKLTKQVGRQVRVGE